MLKNDQKGIGGLLMGQPLRGQKMLTFKTWLIALLGLDARLASKMVKMDNTWSIHFSHALYDDTEILLATPPTILDPWFTRWGPC